jgi:hypothetical protein
VCVCVYVCAGLETPEFNFDLYNIIVLVLLLIYPVYYLGHMGYLNVKRPIF